MWPSKYAFNWNAMDVGPKRDLVGMFRFILEFSTFIVLNFQVISLMLFEIELIFNLVFIIACMNGFIRCIWKIKRMVSRLDYFLLYVVNLLEEKIHLNIWIWLVVKNNAWIIWNRWKIQTINSMVWWWIWFVLSNCTSYIYY